MKKVITSAVMAAAMLGGSGTAALAGEYNGNGDPVPGGVNGKSECSYSGLDLPDEEEGNPEGFDDDWAGYDYHGTQNYGQYVSLGLKAFLPSPGEACNPALAGEH